MPGIDDGAISVKGRELDMANVAGGMGTLYKSGSVDIPLGLKF